MFGCVAIMQQYGQANCFPQVLLWLVSACDLPVVKYLKYYLKPCQAYKIDINPTKWLVLSIFQRMSQRN